MQDAIILLAAAVTDREKIIVSAWTETQHT